MHLLISFITITIILIKKRYKKLTSSNKAENNIHHEKSERLNRKLSIRAIQNCVIHKAVMHTEYTHAEGHCVPCHSFQKRHQLSLKWKSTVKQ